MRTPGFKETIYQDKGMPQDYSSRQLPLVAIVTVTRNRCKLLLRMLLQLKKLDYPADKLSIFLVDGASTDGTVEKVRCRFPEAHIVSTKKKVQIAAAENMGIKEVLKANHKYKYIWLLDDDVEVESQTLMPLVEACENDPSIAVIGSAIYDPKQRDQLITAGLRIFWKKSGLTYYIPETSEIKNVFDVEIVGACSSLTKTDLYEKIGLWDEQFWLYWPDNDWCVRALRNGYRVCCHGKSRAWHRNWLKEQDFYTPYILHGGIRGALLFYLRHSPLKSLASIRNYILKCYLKAAFERFTLRPNYSRAYEEGVQDFLKDDTSMKDFSSWNDVSKLLTIDEICQGLSDKISKHPRIILNQIADESQRDKIKKVIQYRFRQIRWKEIPVSAKASKLDPKKPLKDYLLHYFPSLVLHLLTFYKRGDIIISPISDPHLCNIAAARYTILLDTSLRGFVQKNHVFKESASFFAIITRALKAVYIDLPQASKNFREFKNGATGSFKMSEPSPPGIDKRNVKYI